jgi:hypothetical protein
MGNKAKEISFIIGFCISQVFISLKLEIEIKSKVVTKQSKEMRKTRSQDNYIRPIEEHEGGGLEKKSRVRF